MTFLYNCKSEIDKDGHDAYRITKFDDHMEVESSYLTDGKACDCPAGVRPNCRHREMLPKFIHRGAINSHWFYDYDRGGWVSMGEPADEVGSDSDHEPSFEQAVVETFAPGLNTPDKKWFNLQPHSVAVSTGDFDSPSDGSNPSETTKPKAVFIRRRL